MPDPKNNAKLTGDTHLPDVDDGDATPEARLRDEDDARASQDSQAGKEQPGAGKDKAS